MLIRDIHVVLAMGYEDRHVDVPDDGKRIEFVADQPLHELCIILLAKTHGGRVPLVIHVLRPKEKLCRGCKTGMPRIVAVSTRVVMVVNGARSATPRGLMSSRASDVARPVATAVPRLWPMIMTS